MQSTSIIRQPSLIFQMRNGSKKITAPVCTLNARPQFPRATPAEHRGFNTRASAAMADVDMYPSEVVGNARAMICTSVTAGTVAEAMAEIVEACSSGADIIELRLDFYSDFQPNVHLRSLLTACTLPFIVTYRPKWEGYANLKNCRMYSSNTSW